MNHEEFKREFYKIQPASIKAILDKDDDVQVYLNGRGADLLSLSFCIAESIVKKLPISIDDYCNILKDGFQKNQCQDMFEKMFEKMFEDLFDGQKRTDFD